MKHATRKPWLSGVLCIALLAAAAFGVTGCTADKTEETSVQTLLYAPSDAPHALGEGDTTFPLTVTHLDGTAVEFEISTEQDTVGEALEEVGLISGEEGPYGLMITNVNGETLIYEQHRAYWGFYIDGAYATSGVDTTGITSDCAYALTADKA